MHSVAPWPMLCSPSHSAQRAVFDMMSEPADRPVSPVQITPFWYTLSQSSTPTLSDPLILTPSSDFPRNPCDFSNLVASHCKLNNGEWQGARKVQATGAGACVPALRAMSSN